MGLFDYIKCEYPLPPTPPGWISQEANFQTKDTDAQLLERYTITRAGQLIHHTVRYETVPEEERPYYGTPQWDSAWGKMCGMIRAVPAGDAVVPFHGDLHLTAISDTYPYEFYSLVVRFTNGTVEWIKDDKG